MERHSIRYKNKLIKTLMNKRLGQSVLDCIDIHLPKLIVLVFFIVVVCMKNVYKM